MYCLAIIKNKSNDKYAPLPPPAPVNLALWPKPPLPPADPPINIHLIFEYLNDGLLTKELSLFRRYSFGKLIYVNSIVTTSSFYSQSISNILTSCNS